MPERALAWSPEALEDIDEIAAYIARDSRFYAAAVVQRLLTVGKSLAHFPESGRVVPELGQADLRERFVYSYRLIYRVEAKRILIAAVIHGGRLLGGALAQRFDDPD